MPEEISLDNVADEITRIYTRLGLLRAAVNRVPTQTEAATNAKAAVVHHLDHAVMEVRRASFQIGKVG